jgi:protein O-GlcNAc transferase
LDVEIKLGRLVGIADQYNNLGAVYLEMNRLDKAEEFFKKSLGISKRLGQKEGVAKQYADLGNVYVRRGSHGKAREYWNDSRDLFAEIGMGHMAAMVQGWIDKFLK